MKYTRSVSLGVLTAVLIVAASESRIASQATQRPAPPAFQVDPFWPKELPNNWLVGNVVGVGVDSHDNVWIVHRPQSQAGADKTPAVLAFDQAGNLIRSWGGPGPGYEGATRK